MKPSLSSPRIVLRPMLAMIAFVVTSAVPSPTWSETQIANASGALSIDAHDTTLQEVVVKLSATFGIRFRSSADLSRPVDGSYQGSLREVITRLLDGYDFFVRRSGDVTEVVIVGSSGKSATAAPVAVAAPISASPSREGIELRRLRSTSGRY